MASLPISLWDAAHAVLLEPEPDAKCAAVRMLNAAWLRGEVVLAGTAQVAAIERPGRPEKPELVPPRRVLRRSVATVEGRAILIHALAHIEFNAINLALDAAYRFRTLPAAYYGDWLRVAEEEATHFELLRAHLRTLGHEYGDFPAHNGLWEMALKTAHDPLQRMALVPRLLEARGLDVTPRLHAGLKEVGDVAAAAILDIILRDEIGHVLIGNRWFKHLCRERGLEPAPTFVGLLHAYRVPLPKPPFNMAARRAAGFGNDELAWLEHLAQQSE